MVGKSDIGPKKMYVFKRDGRKEEIYFDKITSRIKKLCYGLDMDHVEPVAITLKVINGLYSGVTTQELDNLAAATAAGMTIEHGDYEILAARIAVSNLQKETKKQFSDVMDDLHKVVDTNLKVKSPMISDFHHEIIMENANRLNSAIIYDRDFAYNYFGFKILEQSYLLKINGKIVERPQHMLMRVAIGIHGKDIDAAIETYNLLSEQYFIHSSQTLQFAGRKHSQLASSYLLSMSDDSIEGIYDTLKQYALIAKYSGGTSINMHCIRSKGTYIAGTNGISNGLVPMLRVYNNTTLLTNRSNSLAIYLEPWHADIFEFLDLKKSTGKDEVRAPDLLYGLWIPDLFMRRVEANEDWSIMCPHTCPGLHERWGEEFERLYLKYETDGQYVRRIKAQQLWLLIIESQLESGGPFLLYKDTCNRKSNQQNIGTIESSSLCADIIQYSSKDEVAVCHVASIAVNMFVKVDRRSFDFEKLKSVTKIVAKNLDKMIDINYYPVAQSKVSNLRHRPIGIGIQGLADAFIMLKLPYESNEAQLLNQQIFETLYYGALEASYELAGKYGPYETYTGSPVSKGILQFDMWNKTPTDLWDWSTLKQNIGKYGIRNSVLISGIPTSTTSQILGNYQSFEAIQSNVYTKNINYPAGEYKMINHHLIKDLTDLDIWDDDLKNKILSLNGSVQDIDEIPKSIKDLYKTGSEIPLKTMFKMSADRGAFIDHSQSFNINLRQSNYGKLSSIHFYGWKLGLKTGMYNLRTMEQQHKLELNNSGIININTNLQTMGKGNTTIDNNNNESKLLKDVLEKENKTNISSNINANIENAKRLREERLAQMVCSLENKDECLMCGS